MKTKILNSFNYLRYSKNLLTSVLFIFPLLILYEILSFLIFYDKDYAIRNSADIFLRSYFYNIGTSSQFLYIIFLSLIVFIYIYVNRKNYYNYKFNSFFNIIMIFEGFIYGLLLIIILNGYNYFLNTSIYVYDDFFLNFYFSLGAGVWEEILFRLFIYNIIFLIVNKILNKDVSYILSIVVSSILFSLFHYFGQMADVITLKSFIIRFVAGIILCLIYIKRGLGISCMTHYSYDVLIFALPII